MKPQIILTMVRSANSNFLSAYKQPEQTIHTYYLTYYNLKHDHITVNIRLCTVTVIQTARQK